ncbi:MAG: ABC transporter permease [Proteobacteria bacterium]|nr:ABC transporter permease [Pseudomonadota bacterium]MBI3497630.1 ABC transporter permease [Pseudomonadota bacterium]
MMLFKIAFRNIRRNARRSTMTASAIVVGAVALVLFGEFMANVTTGFQTNTVERTGHLSVFRAGYFDFGAGNPAAYGIADYRRVMDLIAEDPVLRPWLNVVTPTVTLFGIAGNFDIDASKTFFGSGVVPSDRDRMRLWDEYGIFRGRILADSGLSDDDETVGVVGIGLARALGLCEALKLANCPPRPRAAEEPGETAASELMDLARRDRDTISPQHADAAPRLDLLAATAGGAPNVLSLTVSKAEPQGAKELDDAFIAMHFKLAQRLLYGRGEPKAVGIVLQLHRSEDMAAARVRLERLFKERALELEVRDFTELLPFYKQVIGLFGAIFSFIAAIMGVIVLFTVVNTMSMTVIERTNEIGTARAMGVRRSVIRRQFLIEGWMLGAIGASVGLILAALLAWLINNGGLTWTPPGQALPVPLRVLTSGVAPLNLAVWLGLVAVATVAALIPANRAARLPVVDALRHV